MKFSKVLSLAAVVLAMMAGSATAQNGHLTSAMGTTTAVLMDKRTWTAGVDAKGHMVALYPYFLTIAELSANSDAGYVLLQTKPASLMYDIVYNFTNSDSSTIQSWLALQKQTENNVEISFDSTSAGSWTGTTLNIDTSTWALSVNLNPYDVLNCDIAAAATCAGAALTAATARFSCIEEGIPMLKNCFAPPIGTGCLAFLIRSISLVTTYCTQSPGILSSIVCTDKSEGTEAICKYIAGMMPSGTPGTAIVSADADGTMDSVNGNTGGGSGAAAEAVAGATAAAAALAAMLL